MDTNIETYLGDGLYASFDGYQIVLRAPRVDGDHWVGIEPDVMIALVHFISELRNRFPGQSVPVWDALQAAMKRAAP